MMKASIIPAIFCSCLLLPITCGHAADQSGAGQVIEMIPMHSMNSPQSLYEYWNVVVLNTNDFKARCNVPFLSTAPDDTELKEHHNIVVNAEANGRNIGHFTIAKKFKNMKAGKVECKEISTDWEIVPTKMIK